MIRRPPRSTLFPYPTLSRSRPAEKAFGRGRIFQPGTAGRPVVAPGSIDRWMSFELGRLNAGLVVEKKTLARLLAEPDPACHTREGDAHPFDRAALERLAFLLQPDQGVKALPAL